MKFTSHVGFLMCIVAIVGASDDGFDATAYPPMVQAAVSRGSAYSVEGQATYVVRELVSFFTPDPPLQCSRTCGSTAHPIYCLCVKSTGTFRDVLRSGKAKAVPTKEDCATSRVSVKFEYAYCEPPSKEGYSGDLTFAALIGFNLPKTPPPAEMTWAKLTNAFPSMIGVFYIAIAALLGTTPGSNRFSSFLAWLFVYLGFSMYFEAAVSDVIVFSGTSAIIYATNSGANANVIGLCVGPAIIGVSALIFSWFDYYYGGWILLGLLGLYIASSIVTVYTVGSRTSHVSIFMCLYLTFKLTTVLGECLMDGKAGALYKIIIGLFGMIGTPSKSFFSDVARVSTLIVSLARDSFPYGMSVGFWTLIYVLVVLFLCSGKVLIFIGTSKTPIRGRLFDRLVQACSNLIPETLNAFSYIGANLVEGKWEKSLTFSISLMLRLIFILSNVEIAVIGFLAWALSFMSIYSPEIQSANDGHRGGRVPFTLMRQMLKGVRKISSTDGSSFGSGYAFDDKIVTVKHAALINPVITGLKRGQVGTASGIKCLTDPNDSEDPAVLYNNVDPVLHCNSEMQLIEPTMWQNVTGLIMVNCDGDIVSTGDFSISTDRPGVLQTMCDTKSGDSGSIVFAVIRRPGTHSFSYYPAGVHSSGYGAEYLSGVSFVSLFQNATYPISVRGYKQQRILGISHRAANVLPYSKKARDAAGASFAPVTPVFVPIDEPATSIDEQRDWLEHLGKLRGESSSASNVNSPSHASRGLGFIGHSSVSRPTLFSSNRRMNFVRGDSNLPGSLPDVTDPWENLSESAVSDEEAKLPIEARCAENYMFKKRVSGVGHVRGSPNSAGSFVSGGSLKSVVDDVQPSAADDNAQTEQKMALRRSSRVRKPPVRYSPDEVSAKVGEVLVAVAEMHANAKKVSNLTPTKVYDKFISFLETGANAPSNADCDKFELEVAAVLKQLRDCCQSNANFGDYWINPKTFESGQIRKAALSVLKKVPKLDVASADLVESLKKAFVSLK